MRRIRFAFVVGLLFYLGLVVNVQAQGPFAAQIQAALRAFLAQTHTWTATQTFGNIVVSGCTGCGGGGTPGGANTQVQFNDAGAFGGDAGLTYNKTTDVLSVIEGRLGTNTIPTFITTSFDGALWLGKVDSTTAFYQYGVSFIEGMRQFVYQGTDASPTASAEFDGATHFEFHGYNGTADKIISDINSFQTGSNWGATVSSTLSVNAHTWVNSVFSYTTSLVIDGATNTVYGFTGMSLGRSSTPWATAYINQIDLAPTAGVRFTASDGVLTLLGLGNGADESLTIDLDNAGANTIAFGSGSGANLFTFTGITLSASQVIATDIFQSAAASTFNGPQSNTNTQVFNVYDVNNTTYRTWLTTTASNTPTVVAAVPTDTSILWGVTRSGVGVATPGGGANQPIFEVGMNSDNEESAYFRGSIGIGVTPNLSADQVIQIQHPSGTGFSARVALTGTNAEYQIISGTTGTRGSMGKSSGSNNIYLTSVAGEVQLTPASGFNAVVTTAGSRMVSPLYSATTNCADSAGAAACSAAPVGAVVIDAAATTVVVSTTAVTANSRIHIQEDPSLATELGITCNTTTGRLYTVTARTAATSFTITTSAAPVTNPACLTYWVVN